MVECVCVCVWWRGACGAACGGVCGGARVIFGIVQHTIALCVVECGDRVIWMYDETHVILYMYVLYVYLFSLDNISNNRCHQLK